MTILAIRALGGLGAIDGSGHEMKFLTRTAAALLAYLAMSPGKEFSREHRIRWRGGTGEQAAGEAVVIARFVRARDHEPGATVDIDLAATREIT